MKISELMLLAVPSVTRTKLALHNPFARTTALYNHQIITTILMIAFVYNWLIQKWPAICENVPSMPHEIFRKVAIKIDRNLPAQPFFKLFSIFLVFYESTHAS